MAECSIDGRPCDTNLCSSCLGELQAELRGVPWIVEQLTITLVRMDRIGERNGPRSSERPLPYHAGASVDLESLRDGLAMWAKVVAEHRGVSIDAETEPAALSRWLLRWSGELARHPDAGELHGDIMSLVKAARRTIDLAPEKRFVGPCDGHRATEQVPGCGAELNVWVRPGELPQYVTCGTEDCGARYPMAERRAYLLEAAYDRLLTAAEMSRAISELIPGKPVSPNRISQWAARGRITKYLPHARDPHKRPRFRVEDVISMVRAELAK